MMSTSLARNALLLGNFVTGVAVLAPAGMLNELSSGLGVSIQQAGWLVTFGAVALCIASPLMAWVTTRIDRRMLLAGTLAVITLGHVVSVVAPNYTVLLAARLAFAVVAALYTPQAATTVALIVSEKERPAAIAYVFLGWSLSVAIGLPLVTFVADQFGWRAAYGAIVLLAAIATFLNVVGLPRGVQGTPVSVSSWIEIARSRQIVLLLLITVLVISGTFQVFVYIGPLLTILANASPLTVGFTFAATGAIGFVGNVVTTRVVGAVGTFRLSLILISTMFVGLIVWAAGTGSLAVMLVGIAGASGGFAASNSIQQARLSMAAPDLASASIALNTSGIYVGQAIGSAIGGALIAGDMPHALGYVAAAITGLALLVVLMTRDESKTIKSP
jgi:MFS transporter, DHA1 family, inner membrane transport protein